MGDTAVRRDGGRKFYPEATITVMLEEIAKGITVNKLCENRSFPCVSTFFKWVADDPMLYARYRAAQEKRLKSRATE
jgi:hypothetical protein